MTAKEHLEKAAEIVQGDRRRDYGHPRDNHGCTAALWTAYLDRRNAADPAIIGIDAQDVCVLNILQKLSRYANRRTDDSITDVIGYALNMAMIAEPAEFATPATDTPGNADTVPRETEEAQPSEWPKWVASMDMLRVWASDTRGWVLMGDKWCITSVYSASLDIETKGLVLSRADAAQLFGESAVLAGERLCAEATGGASGQPRLAQEKP